MTSSNVAFPSLYSEPICRVFDGLKKDDLDRYPRLIMSKKEYVYEFTIDFYNNKIITHFKNKKKIIRLSEVLKTISQIYDKNFSLTGHKSSGVSKEFIKQSKHLFDPEFAKLVCPILGFKTDVEGLHRGIRTLYIGRCICSLGKSMRQNKTDEMHEKEFIRIANLIKWRHPTNYSLPIL